MDDAKTTKCSLQIEPFWQLCEVFPQYSILKQFSKFTIRILVVLFLYEIKTRTKSSRTSSISLVISALLRMPPPLMRLSSPFSPSSSGGGDDLGRASKASDTVFQIGSFAGRPLVRAELNASRNFMSHSASFDKRDRKMEIEVMRLEAEINMLIFFKNTQYAHQKQGLEARK